MGQHRQCSTGWDGGEKRAERGVGLVALQISKTLVLPCHLERYHPGNTGDQVPVMAINIPVACVRIWRVPGPPKKVDTTVFVTPTRGLLNTNYVRLSRQEPVTFGHY